MSASELSTIKVDQPFTLKTVALRWIRDCHERPRGFPTHGSVELTRRDPLPVGVLDDYSTGMQYKFKEDARQNWSWKQMLSSLDAKSQKIILGKPRQGVARMTCAPIRGSRDYDLWHTALNIGRPFSRDAPVPVWKFRKHRGDKCSGHPF